MDKHKTQKIMLKNGQNVNLIKNTNDKKNKKKIYHFVYPVYDHKTLPTLNFSSEKFHSW